MTKLCIVEDNHEAWGPYYPSENLVTAAKYLRAIEGNDAAGAAQVINLCDRFDYLSVGYYCSLLADARGHRIIPTTTTIYDLQNHGYYRLYDRKLEGDIDRFLGKTYQPRNRPYFISIYFGLTAHGALKQVARRIFELYPCPILRVTLARQGRWSIAGIESAPISRLSEREQNLFAEAIEHYSRKIWRKPRARRNHRFEMAILHNPQEATPPSDDRALKNFQRIGQELGLEVDLVTEEDYSRLLEYDALFIRETTALNHHTCRFSKRADSEGLVVIDDPESILRCTNKVFLADLLSHRGVSTPKTQLLVRDEPIDFTQLEAGLDFPMILKIPDGSFSRGVIRVKDVSEFETAARALFKESAILLAQEYIPTDFDWRIGVLNNRPIFACQYFMAEGHWQIYNHSQTGASRSGKFQTLGVHQVPRPILKLATRATRLIGTGLYGVDIKQHEKRCVVIEVNDNPNIDSGVEDHYLGDDLYRIILGEFMRRLERQRHAH